MKFLFTPPYFICTPRGFFFFNDKMSDQCLKTVSGLEVPDFFFFSVDSGVASGAYEWYNSLVVFFFWKPYTTADGCFNAPTV